MSLSLRISLLGFLFIVSGAAFANVAFQQFVEIDSLIKEKHIDKDMAQLELLVLYHDALKGKPKDSIKIFKHLAILNAYLEQPEDACRFAVKYINNTLDFSILSDNAFLNIKHTNEYDQLSQKYMPKVGWITFLFFYAALIGFFFMVIVNFSKETNRYAKLFISGFVGVHSLFILEFVLYISNYQYRFPHTYLMASSVALLYGPLLYFYFKNVTHNYKFKGLDLLHFLPNLILIAYLSPMYLLTANEKVRIMLELDTSFNINRYIIFISKVISLTVYAIIIGKLRYADKRKTTVFIDYAHPINEWKKAIYHLHIAYVICYVIYGLPVSGILVFTSTFLIYAQVGAMSLMVIYIAYKAYVQPNIFHDEFNPVDGLFKKKYQKSGLTNALSEELKEHLLLLLINDKVYKQNSINLEILSEKLNTTRHNTSQIINEHFNMNFFELINKFRIKEAISIIENDKHGCLNIIDVAYEVGYNNKVTFNKAFKKETSVTPTEYIQNISNLKLKVKR